MFSCEYKIKYNVGHDDTHGYLNIVETGT